MGYFYSFSVFLPTHPTVLSSNFVLYYNQKYLHLLCRTRAYIIIEVYIPVFITTTRGRGTAASFAKTPSLSFRTIKFRLSQFVAGSGVAAAVMVVEVVTAVAV